MIHQAAHEGDAERRPATSSMNSFGLWACEDVAGTADDGRDAGFLE